jgi:hypothetical protein
MVTFGVDSGAIQFLLPPKVRGWANTRKSDEVANEMRLVEVAALGCELRPIGSGLDLRSIHGMLESPHATEKLRRQPDLICEQLDKTALAQADLACHISCLRLTARPNQSV